jgi:hypothetical protein
MDDLNAAVEDAAQAFDACEGLPDTIRLLLALRDASRNLAVLTRWVEGEVAARMEETSVEVPGVGMVTRHKRAKSTEWDSDALFGELCRTDDPLETLRACLPLTKSLSWRRGKLAEHGVDADEFCRREWTDRWAVQVQ